MHGNQSHKATVAENYTIIAVTERKTHVRVENGKFVRAVEGAYWSAGEADEGHLALQLVPGEGDRLEDVPQLLLDVDRPLEP